MSSVFQVGVAALSPQDFPAQNLQPKNLQPKNLQPKNLQPQGFQPQNVQAQTEPSVAMIAINLVFQLIYQVLSIFLGLGLTQIGLNFLDGKKVEVGMLFGEGNKLLPAIGATILFSLMVVVGLIFLIVPGIYLALRYGQFLNGIVDRDLGVMDSFAYSSSLTTNNKMPLFILWIFCVLIFIVGMLACGIGLIFAAPVIWLSMLAAYRWMQYGHRAPSWINPAQRHRCSLANSKA